ncbi:hypothetical protein ABIE85_001665 [Bradyrhizobium diazoefficiens]
MTSGVVLAKARTHTAESIDYGRWEYRTTSLRQTTSWGNRDERERSRGGPGFRQDDDTEAPPTPYFFTLLASILMAGSSILVVNAVVTSNGFSMPR